MISSVRLLSSVAVVGRDNEPIYLRGDLSDVTTTTSCSSNTPSPPNKKQIIVTEDEGGGDENDDEVGSNKIHDDEPSSSPNGNSSNKKKGLFGRIIKGKVAGRNTQEDTDDDDDDEHQKEQIHDEEDDDDDPFGFFSNSNNTELSSSSTAATTSTSIPAMSLTQQLVLHASLDRFEEMASRSNKGGSVRWRTPGSNSANAMWMGLLCQVEERWDVYGTCLFFALCIMYYDLLYSTYSSCLIIQQTQCWFM